jgi:hypothetical protein
MTETPWYVQFPDIVAGPFAWWELRDLNELGVLVPSDLISQDREKWIPARKVIGANPADVFDWSDLAE